jgi:hypothetical protein
MALIHDCFQTSFTTFDNAFNNYEQPNIEGQQTIQTAEIYDWFMGRLGPQITNSYQQYAVNRLIQLSQPWYNILNQNPTVQQAAIANEILAQVQNIIGQLADIKFDTSAFP